MARYSASNSKTNTASATVPMWNVCNPPSGTLRRGALYQLIIGSDATPADVAAKFVLQRTTADGTISTAFTATALDPADPAAIEVCNLTWSVNPTITASSDLLTIGMNGRATVIWTAPPYGEIRWPATAEYGVALMCTVASTAQNFNFNEFWEE